MRIIPRLVPLLFFLVLRVCAGAQNCGCADEGNCPFPVVANSTTQVCYEITDAFNNSLASPAQGVCGVAIRFRHGRIGELDLTLTSPDGTQVQLTGTSGNCNTLTPVATWDILFVPCAEPCYPDTVGACAYPCVFNNCPSPCAWGNANYSGSYRPFAGCLEDFDTGPVNGLWCIEAANGAQFNSGNIMDFEVILCDQSGIFCCDADAGNLSFEPDVDACVGDTSLLLDLDPTYGAVVPDTAEYGYTFVVFENGTVAEYDTLPDLRAYLPGTYQVCGLSFLETDLTDLPAIGSAWTAQAIADTLASANPPFCGDIATNCIVVSIAAPPPPTMRSDTICEGDSIVVGNTAYLESGVYADTLQTPFGCDSIVNLDLTVLPLDTVLLAPTICAGDTVWVGSQPFTSAGSFTAVLQNSFGCDSTVFLDLTVLPLAQTDLVEVICKGDTVVVGNTSYMDSGIFHDTLATAQGCDSIVTLNLTVVEINVSIAPPDTLDCAQPTAVLTATASASMGTPGFIWSTIGGTISGPLTLATATATSEGEYIVTASAAGCSSADTVAVVQDANLPVAAILAQHDTLNCFFDTLQLDGSSSSPAGGFTWEWMALGGSPIAFSNSLVVEASLPDEYWLIVTNASNGCKDTAQLIVYQNITPPTANAGDDQLISCTAASATLDGSGSTGIGGLSYNWSAGSGGNILPPSNIAMPVVDEPGVYQLTVTSLANFCQDVDTVAVLLDTLAPVAAINLPDGANFTCTTDTVTLDGSASSGSPTVFYQWVGNILTGQGTPVATTTATGNFTLILSDPANGCADTASVAIGQDFNYPTADAGPDDSLSCTQTSTILGSANNPVGPQFLFSWTATPGGSFLTQVDSVFVTVDSAATYLLTVTNLLNGCMDTDTVVVADAATPPVANAGPDYVFNCADTTFVLDGSNSTVVPFTEFEWRNSAGTLISQDVQVMVNYPDTFYFIVEFGFCKDTDLVVVATGTTPPIADAGADAVLDCATGEALLNGSASANGPGIGYFWSALSGVIAAGQYSPTPTVTEPGVYLLEIFDSTTACNAFDTVAVQLDTALCTPLADAGADGLYNCFSSTYSDTLQAAGSVGPQFSYFWAALSGNVLDQTDPFSPIVTAGEFVFTVTNFEIGLFATDTVLVVADTLRPVADAGTANILSLTCPELADCYQLDASNSSTGPQFTYLWEAGLGTICTDPTELNAQVLGEDIYNLTVFDQANGCQAADAVLVRLADFLPDADAGPDVQVPCGEATDILDGSGSSIGQNYQYEWWTTSGNIVGGSGTPTPEVMPVNDSDTFLLIVFNETNLCRDTDEVVIYAPVGCTPDCFASVTGVLDCVTDTVFLSASGSSVGANISLAWTAVTGHLCGGETAPLACADAPGIYTLTVTRTYPNGSQFDASCQVQVLQNTQPPVANAGPDGKLTCTDNSLIINGNGSSTGPNFTYAWTTPTGHFCGGQTTSTPCVDAVGQYELLVTDTLNGCTATDAMSVGLDTLHPVANAGPGDQLSCGNSTAVLQGSAAPSNAAFFWTTQDGDICAGAASANPVVCDAGTYCLTVTLQANGCTDSACTVVTEDNTLPNPNAGPDLFYTCADTVFTIQATASGGNFLSYEWTASNGGCFIGPTNVLQPTVACPGTYTLTVTDLVSNCEASNSLEVVEQTTPPVAEAGLPQVINCENLFVQLDGSGSLPVGQISFEWTTLDGHLVSDETTATPTVDSAGTYNLLVINQMNQCRDTASVVVTRDTSIPVVHAGPDTTLTCTRTSLLLDGTLSAVGNNLAYTWTASNGGNIVGGANTLTPTIDQPGTYQLTILDTASQCLVTDETTVAMDTLRPLAVAVAAQPALLTCSTQQLQLIGSNSTPADSLTFAWATQDGHIFSGTNAPNSIVDSSGTYSLTVTHTRNGCSHTTQITVNEDYTSPIVEIQPPAQIDCNNPTVQLTVLPIEPAYSYQWDGPGIIDQPATPAPTVSSPGVFSVSVTDPSNGCSATASTVVTENLAPPVASAATLGMLDCDNLTVEVTGQGSSAGNVSYLWTTAGQGSIADQQALATTVDAPGWYVLTVKKLDNGCSATDSTEVLANSLPIDNVIITLDHPDCRDVEGYITVDSVVGGTPPYYFSLNGDIFITYPQFSYLDPGNFELVVQDVNGCEWAASVALLPPGEVLVELGDDISIRQGESVVLEALTNLAPGQVDTVFWSNLPDSAACPTCLEQMVSPSKTTVYRIHVIDTNGCSALDKITVWVNEEQPFYAPTAFSPNGDGANDRFLIYAGKDVVQVKSLQIFDRWGNRVFHQQGFPPNDPQHGWDGVFEGSPMNPAVFVWRAELEFVDGETGVFTGDLTLVR